jgi:LPXTG-site transpeptidase (sortase) family protein
VTSAPPTETAVLEVVEPEPEAEEPRRPRITRDTLRRDLLRLLLVALGLVGLVLFFEYPLGQTWFHARQRHLLTDFRNPAPHLQTGHAASVLQIPSQNLNLMVVQGTGSSELRAGPGHDEGTPLPGHRGNSIIAGHRDAWGGPFARLANVRKGRLIVTQGRASKITVYRVTTIRHNVPPSDNTLFAQGKDFRLTLVTGDGGRFSSDRLIVQAVSGTSLHPTQPGKPLPLPRGSLLLNLPMLFALLAALAAAGAVWYLRRRYGLGALLVVVVPLGLAFVFAVFVEIDLLLPPLR